MKTHLDLCSGIGGFALAAQWSGYDTIGFCEIDPWCRRVLAKHWPGVPQHDDLWTLTGATVRDWIGERQGVPAGVGHVEYANGRQRQGTGGSVQAGRCGIADASASPRLDLITGGYPCQPFSLAGKRLGAEDDRHLWPAIAALVADLRPAKCLFENVAGHITMGLDAVLSQLEALGYTCWPVVIPAAAVGAPHRRDRVWIIAAHTDSHSEPVVAVDGDTGRGIVGAQDVADAEARGVRRGESPRETGLVALRGKGCTVGVSPNADCAGRQEQRWSIAVESEHAAAERDCGREALGGMGDTSDGLPGWLPGPGRLNPWAGDWEAGCPRTTTHEQDRTHKLKALGNAIVPQVAYEILRAWEESEVAA